MLLPEEFLEGMVGSACLGSEVALVSIAMLSFLKLLDVIATCSNWVLQQPTSQLHNSAQTLQRGTYQVYNNTHVLQQVSVTIIYVLHDKLALQ